MFVMMREKQDTDKVKTIFVENPRFDIDEVRRIKAFIRFNTKSVTVNKQAPNMVIHDLHTMLKFGRCVSITTIGGALYRLCICVAGKEKDSMYVLQPIYKDGDIYLTIVSADFILNGQE